MFVRGLTIGAGETLQCGQFISCKQPLQDIFKSQQYPVSNSCRFKPPSTGVLEGWYCSQVGFTSDKFKCNDTRMVPPHWNRLLGCAVPTPLMKVKDGGFQHDENHANCRSKGKILWTSQLQLPCGPSFGRSPGIDSRIPAGSGLCDIIRSIQVSRAAAAFLCRARLNRSLPRPCSMGHCLVDI